MAGRYRYTRSSLEPSPHLNPDPNPNPNPSPNPNPNPDPNPNSSPTPHCPQVRKGDLLYMDEGVHFCAAVGSTLARGATRAFPHQVRVGLRDRVGLGIGIGLG